MDAAVDDFEKCIECVDAQDSVVLASIRYQLFLRSRRTAISIGKPSSNHLRPLSSAATRIHFRHRLMQIV